MTTIIETEISSSEIHHVAWLNWVKDGRPEGQDMEYWIAAQMLLEEAHSVAPLKVQKRGKAKAYLVKGKSKHNLKASARASSSHWNELES